MNYYHIDYSYDIARIAELLLINGANPDKPMVTPSGNMSPLAHASLEGDAKMVEILLSHGATDSDMKVSVIILCEGM